MFTCVFCSQKSKDAEKMHEHVYAVHKMWFCIGCEAYFGNEHKYKEHNCTTGSMDENNSEHDGENRSENDEVSESEGNNICDDSLLDVTPPIDGIEHLRQAIKHTENGLLCFCGTVYREKGSLSKHHKSSECSVRKCTECNRKLGSFNSLLTHRCAKKSLVKYKFSK